jgi:hypothetical protein
VAAVAELRRDPTAPVAASFFPFPLNCPPPPASYSPAPIWPGRLFRQGPKPPHDLPHRLACLPPPTPRLTKKNPL